LSSCSTEQFYISYQTNHFVVFKKKINNYELPPLQNSFIDLTILQDDELSVIQDYLSINKLKDYDYDVYQKQSIIDKNNYKPIIIDDDIINIIDNDDIINNNYDDNNYQSVVEQPIINEAIKHEREQNLNLLGLLMGIDNSYVLNTENINGYLVYQEAKDFRFTITQQDALNKLILCINQDSYHWNQWEISNYYLVELLKEQAEFPPQISVTVNKTYEIKF